MWEEKVRSRSSELTQVRTRKDWSTGTARYLLVNENL